MSSSPGGSAAILGGWRKPSPPPLRAPSPLGTNDDGVRLGVPAAAHHQQQHQRRHSLTASSPTSPSSSWLNACSPPSPSPALKSTGGGYFETRSSSSGTAHDDQQSTVMSSSSSTTSASASAAQSPSGVAMMLGAMSISPPPQQWPPPRPPSQEGAPQPMRPSLRSARRDSRLELQRIVAPARELVERVDALTRDLCRVARALVNVKEAILLQWTVPSKVARIALRSLVLALSHSIATLSISSGFLRHTLPALSRAFVTLLDAQLARGHERARSGSLSGSSPTSPPTSPPLSPPTLGATLADDTHLLEAVERAREKAHDQLKKAESEWRETSIRLMDDVELTLEQAMDPDNFGKAGRELTNQIVSLRIARTSASRSLARLISLLSSNPDTDATLDPARWHATLLSPPDLRDASVTYSRALADVPRDGSDALLRVARALVRDMKAACFLSSEDAARVSQALFVVDGGLEAGGKTLRTMS